MPVTVDPEVYGIVTPTEDSALLLVKSVVLVAGEDDGLSFLMDAREAGTMLLAGSHLNPGDRVVCRHEGFYWEIGFDGSEVVAGQTAADAVDDAYQAWIDDGAPPLQDEAPSSSAATEAAATKALSDQGATGDPNTLKRQAEELKRQTAILEALPKGYEYLFFMHDLIQRSLDLAEQENEMVTDALTMAIDQVQDMRITWLEKPPRGSWTEVLIVASLIVVLEMGVAALAAQLIFRAIRISQKIKIKRNLREAKDSRQEAVSLLQNLELKHQAALQKAREKWLDAQAQRTAATNFSERYRTDKLILQRGEEYSRARQRGPAEGFQVRSLNAEIERVNTELDRLSGDLVLTEATKRLGQNDRFDKLVDPYLKNLSPSVSSAISKYTKEAAKGGASMPKGQKEKPPEAVPAGNKSEQADGYVPGDTPSTILRSQALRWRRTQKLEISQLRRKIDALYHQALLEPEVLEIALAGMRETAAAVVLQEAMKLDYARAMRDLSLQFELQIWALVLGQIKLSKTDTTDFILKSKNYKAYVFDFLVEGVHEEVTQYLLKRFGNPNVYDEREIARIVNQMTQIRQDIFKASEEVLKKYSVEQQNHSTEELVEPGELKLHYEAGAQEGSGQPSNGNIPTPPSGSSGSGGEDEE